MSSDTIVKLARQSRSAVTKEKIDHERATIITAFRDMAEKEKNRMQKQLQMLSKPIFGPGAAK